MELKEILAISGQPGLYKYVAQSTRGVIVESLVDGRRLNAPASSKVSALTEISMYTEGDDIPLAEVFTRIYAHTGGKEAISHKESPEKLRAAFGGVVHRVQAPRRVRGLVWAFSDSVSRRIRCVGAFLFVPFQAGFLALQSSSKLALPSVVENVPFWGRFSRLGIARTSSALRSACRKRWYRGFYLLQCGPITSFSCHSERSEAPLRRLRFFFLLCRPECSSLHLSSVSF